MKINIADDYRLPPAIALRHLTSLPSTQLFLTLS